MEVVRQLFILTSLDLCIFAYRRNENVRGTISLWVAFGDTFPLLLVVLCVSMS